MTSPVSSTISGLLGQTPLSQDESDSTHQTPHNIGSQVLYNVQIDLGLGGLQSLNVLDTAIHITKQLAELQNSPRFVAGAQTCYDQLQPWCASACGCPQCGCPEGECGCGSFGSLLCDCFKACCLPLETTQKNENTSFFQELSEMHGPVATAMAFDNLGISIPDFLNGDVTCDEEKKSELQTKAQESQNNLSDISQQKHNRQVLSALMSGIYQNSSDHQAMKTALQNSVKDLCDMTTPPPTPLSNIFLELGWEGGNLLSIPLTEQTLVSTMQNMNLFDLDTDSAGRIGTKEATIATKIITQTISKWCTVSSPGVKLTINDSLFNTLLGLTLLGLGYVPGNKNNLSQESKDKLSTLRETMYIDTQKMWNLFFYKTRTTTSTAVSSSAEVTVEVSDDDMDSSPKQLPKTHQSRKKTPRLPLPLGIKAGYQTGYRGGRPRLPTTTLKEPLSTRDYSPQDISDEEKGTDTTAATHHGSIDDPLEGTSRRLDEVDLQHADEQDPLYSAPSSLPYLGIGGRIGSVPNQQSLMNVAQRICGLGNSIFGTPGSQPPITQQPQPRTMFTRK